MIAGISRSQASINHQNHIVIPSENSNRAVGMSFQYDRGHGTPVERGRLAHDPPAHAADDADRRLAGVHVDAVNAHRKQVVKREPRQPRPNVPPPEGREHDKAAPVGLAPLLPRRSRRAQHPARPGAPADGSLLQESPDVVIGDALLTVENIRLHGKDVRAMNLAVSMSHSIIYTQ